MLYLLYVAITRFQRITYAYFPIYKWFTFLILYLTIEFVVTVSAGIESLGLSLAIYRNYLFFFSFILYQELRKSEIRNVIIGISIATIVAAIVYVTQPIHHLAILDNALVSTRNLGELGVRYRNIPELLYFILIYITIRFDLFKWKSVIIFSLCGISLVLTQHRGVMIGYVVIILVYIFMSKKTNKAIQYGLIGIVGFMAVGSTVLARFENKGRSNTFDDISYVVNLDYTRAAASGYDDEGGTLAFRVLLFVERIDYFKSHPQYMLTGVGMRHEDSPKTQREFDFVLGSRKLDKQTGLWLPQQIDSGDLVWFTPFMKFGFVGLGLYLYITCLVVFYLFKNRRKGTIAMTTFLYYFLLIIISLKNAMLFGAVQISFLFMLIELIRRTKAQNLDDRIKYQEFRLLGRNWI